MQFLYFFITISILIKFSVIISSNYVQFNLFYLYFNLDSRKIMITKKLKTYPYLFIRFELD